MKGPITFSSHQDIRKFLELYQKDYEAQPDKLWMSWQVALSHALVVSKKDKKTYLLEKIDTAKRMTALLSDSEMQPLLQHKQSGAIKNVAPNKALTHALIKYNTIYAFQSQNKELSLSPETFWVHPDKQYSKALPLFLTSTADTVSTKTLEKHQRSKFLNLLRSPIKTVKQLNWSIQLIEGCIFSYPEFYHPYFEKQTLDIITTSINHGLLSFLLVNDRSHTYQKEIYTQLKQYHADYKLWQIIHTAGIISCALAILIMQTVSTHMRMDDTDPFHRLLLVPISLALATYLLSNAGCTLAILIMQKISADMTTHYTRLFHQLLLIPTSLAAHLYRASKTLEPTYTVSAIHVFFGLIATTVLFEKLVAPSSFEIQKQDMFIASQHYLTQTSVLFFIYTAYCVGMDSILLLKHAREEVESSQERIAQIEDYTSEELMSCYVRYQS